jgi:hypothetical protein
LRPVAPSWVISTSAWCDLLCRRRLARLDGASLGLARPQILKRDWSRSVLRARPGRPAAWCECRKGLMQ